MTYKNTRRGKTQQDVYENSHSRGSLSEIYNASCCKTRQRNLLKGVRGRCQIKFGMTPLFNNGGFTLIELLVVVLIIGILAAVAVPQYQVAVEKSRATEMLEITGMLVKHINFYVSVHGYPAQGEKYTFTGTDNQLEFDIPCERENNYSCWTKNFWYDAACNSSVCYIWVTPNNTTKYDYDLWIYPGRKSYSCTNVKGNFCTYLSKHFDTISY